MFIIGFLKDIFTKNSEIEWMFDLDLVEDTSTRIQYRKLALQICTNMIARTLSQSEFRIVQNKEDRKQQEKQLYYRLNVRPNRNQSASVFWHKVVNKLVYDNSCLIIRNDTEELQVADSFDRIQSANYEDTFVDVTVKGYTYQRSFRMEDVYYLEYSNDNITKIIEALYEDYGRLLGRIFDTQQLTGGVRSGVKLESITGTSEEKSQKIQNYIDRVYGSVKKNVFALFPEQKGMEYKEHHQDNRTPSVDEADKTFLSYLDQTARALGIPPSLARNEVADNEKQVENYEEFCINPLAKKLADELTAKSFSRNEYFEGWRIVVRSISRRAVMKMADKADKMISSGVMNGNEVRDFLGLPHSGDPAHEKYLITKNYQELDEGGDN